MVEKIYFKNSDSENIFGELFRGGMFDQNIVILVQHSNNKIEEHFYEELVSNLKHNNIPYFRLYDFDSKDNTNRGVDSIIKAIEYLEEIGYYNYILFGKNKGAIYCIEAGLKNKGIGAMLLVNPGDKEINFGELIEKVENLKAKVSIVQSGGMDDNIINNVKNLADVIDSCEFEIIEGADNNYSFVRDYRRMYRSVIEFIIENK